MAKSPAPSKLETLFLRRWRELAPDLPPEAEYVLPAWEAWASERKALGLVSRRVTYRADFAWPAARVALEIQGATWTLGGHSSGAGIERDCAKSLTGQAGGWCCLQLTGSMLQRQHQIWLPKIAELIRGRTISAA